MVASCHTHSKPNEIHRRELEALKEDMEQIIKERKNRLRRFVSAKRHRDELKDVLVQMDVARIDYTVRYLHSRCRDMCW